jgi:glutamyl-tRNA reductase
MTQLQTQLEPPFQYIGAHYTSCPVEIRELWTKAFDSVEGRQRLALLVREHLGHARAGVVPIFTCNRFDLCFEGCLTEDQLLAMFCSICSLAADVLQSTHRVSFEGSASEQSEGSEVGSLALHGSLALRAVAQDPKGRLLPMIRHWQGAQAVQHLFRVACSLDSLVLGEPHILGQLKEELARARDLGLSSPAMEGLFSRAFGAAKRVRTETDLGRNAVSIGHAAVTLAARIFDDLSRHKVLVLGAGEMARLAAQHLLARGAEHVTVGNRTLANAQSLAESLDARAIKLLGLAEALDRLWSFDIVIVATASRQLLVEERHLKNWSKMRRGEPAVIVDVSVPRNVSPECAAAAPDLFVFDIDDLEKVMESNRERRREAAQRAELVIAELTQQFVQKNHERQQLNAVAQFHRFVHDIVRFEVGRSLVQGADPNAAAQIAEQADTIARAVAKKLVSHAAQQSRRAELTEDEVAAAVAVLFPACDIPSRHLQDQADA